jgi:anti-sigma B factor antagonist
MEKNFVYKHLRLEGTREALIVFFISPKIFTADEIQGVGRELLRAADVAARIDMPLVVNFQEVESVSSAFVGKWVLLNRKAKSHGVKLRYRNMSPVVDEVFRRTLGGDGPIGAV